MTVMWNEARTGLLVPNGAGGLRFIEGGPEFEVLRETALDYVPPVDPEPDMAVLRLEARRQVVAMIDARELAITGPVPANERASWGTKADAARAWLASQSQPVPALIAEEAVTMGEAVQTVASRIVARADAWEPITARHTAFRRTAEAAIAAAETPAAVTAAITALQASLG